MQSLVEQWGAQIGWEIRKCNLIVEGASDAKIFKRAAELYFAKHGIEILSSDFGISAAGAADDGGVEGINRRLSAARQIADADRGSGGELLYRFIGLFDNDQAGRRALLMACNFDSRLSRYQDLFLLNPCMPIAPSFGTIGLEVEVLKLNAQYKGLDWEIEDLLSNEFHKRFQRRHPDGLISELTISGKTHREYTSIAKRKFCELVLSEATLNDILEVVRVLRAMRSYLYLPHDHIML